MKAVKVVLILVGTFFVISWLRQDHGGFGSVVKTLPFCGGYRPSFYDIGAIALVILLFWGFRRLKGVGRDTDEPDDVGYEDEYEWEQEPDDEENDDDEE